MLMEPITVSFRLNGKEVSLLTDPLLSVADLLREKLRMTGTKKGCEEGECGSCTVLLDGAPVCSCILLSGQLEGTDLVTIEGLVDPLSEAVKSAFITEGAVQCGFCTPGLVVSAVHLLRRTPCPSEEEIRVSISGNICRCTGYVKIVRAIQKASEELGKNDSRSPSDGIAR